MTFFEWLKSCSTTYRKSRNVERLVIIHNQACKDIEIMMTVVYLNA